MQAKQTMLEKIRIPTTIRKIIEFLLKNKRTCQILLTAVIFSFLFRFLFLNWEKLSEHQFRLRYPYLILSMCFMLGNTALARCGWCIVLRALGTSLGYKASFRITARAEIAKYLPGGIWNDVGRVSSSKAAGIPTHQAVLGVLIEKTLLLVAGASTFLGTLVFWENLVRKNLIVVSIAIIAAAILLLHPKVFATLVNFGLRILFKKKPISNLSFGYDSLLKLGLFYLFITVLGGIAFYFFVLAFYSAKINLPVVIGMCAIAWVIGFLVIFSPQGLGVREGVLAGLLQLYMPLPTAIVIALSYRLWQVIKEIILFSIALMI